MMAPPMMAPPMMAPSFPGLGVVAGLGAVSAINDGMRENRQYSEIRDARQQVQEAKLKNAELEARLNALERQGVVPQQMAYPQQQMVPAGVAP
jgi:hypothetical protein